MTPDAAFGHALTQARTGQSFDRMIVAVSGGGDSMALLHLARDWGQGAGVAVEAVTVDHGLRPEAADEARMVAGECDGLGMRHDTLEWRRESGGGNLQSAARAARYDLIAAHVGARPGTCIVLLGHTADDVAETFLMRLARGSGVDGLARMRGYWTDRGVRWLRPLLDVRRAALRDVLRERGVGWVEDPSNEDEQFDRVKARGALEALAPLGLGVERLTTTAAQQAVAREALEHWAAEAAARVARVEAGDVVFDHRALDALPDETRDRLLAHAIMWVSGATYRPRHDALTAVQAGLRGGGRATLGGCLLSARSDQLRVAREPGAVATLTAPLGTAWDGRWQIRPPEGTTGKGLTVRALGEAGLSACPDWRDSGLPRTSLLASPAVFSGDTLIAAPLAGVSEGYSAELGPQRGDFVAALLSR